MTETTDLEGLKAPELRKLAKELGVNSFGKSNDDLRAEIVKAREAAAADKPAPAEPVEGGDAGDVYYANGVFVPDGIEPGKSPGWPLYETESGDWLPLDLTDEQRAALADVKLEGEGATDELVVAAPAGDRRIVLDKDGDYIAVEVEPEPSGDDVAGQTEIQVTAAAAALAEEDGVDLRVVEGTGDDGRIVEADVEGHIEKHGIEVPPDGVATTLSSDGAVREITRSSDSAWWCPFDDHSQLLGMPRCARCGAEREGDVAVRR